MPATSTGEATAQQQTSGQRVVRNAIYLTISQALTVPLAVLVNVFTARYLGAEAFGYMYLAATFASFAYLAVSWGHEGVLPALVAPDHSSAGRLLGTSLAWCAVVGIAVYPPMAAACHLLGHGSELQWALGLTFIGSVLTSFVAACKDTVRGFERADIPAFVHVGQQLLWACLVIPALLFGGRLLTVLMGANVAAAIALVWILTKLKPVGIGRLSVDRSSLQALFRGGTPFVFLGLAMSLQPVIDASFLARLSTVEAVGWYAVARKLIGLLLFPASGLIGALYPTLCRLWVEDREDFLRMTRGALHSVALIVVPIALGCFLFPDLGVSIFSKQAYGPAADDLRILSLFLFLVYFTMPIGTCVLAAGKRRAWSIVQSLCVAVSLILDPLLTPWFEKRYANGGLGPSIASVVSELLVVALGLWLMPPGVFDARLRRTLLLTGAAGLAMAGVAWLLSSTTPFVTAPLALLAYGAVLWTTGEVDRSHVAKVTGVVTRKLNRAR